MTDTREDDVQEVYEEAFTNPVQPSGSISRHREHDREVKEQSVAPQTLCPQCQATDNNPYVTADGTHMRACGRCMIQWRDPTHAPRSPEVEGWKPFSTAPKDGTEFIVYREDAGVFTAFCQELEGEEPVWFSAAGDDLTGDLPTLWQALPAPPKKAEVQP